MQKLLDRYKSVNNLSNGNEEVNLSLEKADNASYFNH